MHIVFVVLRKSLFTAIKEDGPTSTTTHCDVRREGSDPKTSQLLAIMESCNTTVAMIHDTSLLIKAEEEKKKTTTMTNKSQEKYNDTIVTTVAASTTTTKLQSLLMDKILRLVLHTSKNIARMNNHNHNQREMDDHSTGSNPILLMANDLEEDRTQLLVTNFFSSVRSSIYQNQQQS